MWPLFCQSALCAQTEWKWLKCIKKKEKGKRQSTSLRWWKEYKGEGLALLSECPWCQCTWDRTLDLVTHDLSHTTTWAGGDKDESGDVDRFPPSKGEGTLVSSNDPGVSLLLLRLGLKTFCYGLESQINATGKSKARQRLHGTCLAESPTKDRYESVAPSEPDGLSSFIRAEKGAVPFIFPTTGRKNTHTDTLIYSDVQLHSKVAHSLLGQNHTIFIKFPNLPQNFQHNFSWKNLDIFFKKSSLFFFPELSELQSTEFSFPLRLRHIADTVSADWGRGKTQRHPHLLCQWGEALATHSQRLNSLVHVQFEISTAISKRDTANKKIKKESLREQSSSVATKVVPKSEECLWLILVAIQWNSMTFVAFYAWHRMQNKQKGKEQLACVILCGCLKH